MPHGLTSKCRKFYRYSNAFKIWFILLSTCHIMINYPTRIPVFTYTYVVSKQTAVYVKFRNAQNNTVKVTKLVYASLKVITDGVCDLLQW